MPKTEECEWTSAWCDKLSEDGVKRALLIGDSITLGYRPFVRDMLDGIMTADMFATSRVLDNEDFFIELNQVLKSVKYDIIHFNNGLHGWHQTDCEYEANIEKGLKFLRVKQPGARIIMVTSTARTVKERPEIKHEENEIILRRNEIVKKLAEKYGYEVDDLYPVTASNPELHRGDEFHYNDNGSIKLAEQVVKIINKE